MNELEAKQLLRERGIEMGMDPRSPIDVAKQLLRTGSPALQTSVEVTPVEEPAIAELNLPTVY
jgi:hypothetical protein